MNVNAYRRRKRDEAHTVFIESDEMLGFENTGMVYAPEFIEDENIILGETSFHFGELIER